MLSRAKNAKNVESLESGRCAEVLEIRFGIVVLYILECHVIKVVELARAHSNSYAEIMLKNHYKNSEFSCRTVRASRRAIFRPVVYIALCHGHLFNYIILIRGGRSDRRPYKHWGSRP